MRVRRRIPQAQSHLSGTARARLIFASIAVQSIEFYDFLIYGTAASLVFGKLFFPSVSPVAGILATFATFAVGFAGRPLGAVIFGRIGDRAGRKPALLAATLLMAVSSTLIGLLPTYSAIGVAAPVLLAIVRVIQGISLGGQWGGATLLSLESAPAGRRGLFGALPQLGVVVGVLAGTGVFLAVSALTQRASSPRGAGACRSCSASSCSRSYATSSATLRTRRNFARS
jgi:MFS family permease